MIEEIGVNWHLAVLGYLTIGLVLLTLLWKKLSPIVALTVIPIIFALIGGFGWDVGKFAIGGVKCVAPIACMFIFAILFFGIMDDAGMFDPIINAILKFARNDSIKIAIGTAVLAMVCHLEGSGAVTFVITIPAMLPLWKRLNMNKLYLACIVALAAGTMNMVPWGGPTIRAAVSLGVPIMDVYGPMIIPQVCGLGWLIWIFGTNLSLRVLPTTLGQSEQRLHIEDLYDSFLLPGKLSQLVVHSRFISKFNLPDPCKLSKSSFRRKFFKF